MALTSCIEEVEPTNGVTQDQLNSSIKAGQATIFAMPAHMVEYSDFASWHGNFGYPGYMQVRDRLLDEMVCAKSGTTYNQWGPFEQGRFDRNYWFPQVIWRFYSQQILSCNKALQTYPAEIESEEGKGARSIALAFRAMVMLDAARWFEFLPTEKYPDNKNAEGNDVLKLTIPVVTENMTEEEARNNPRVHHDKMVRFLLDDLEYAEENIEKAPAELKVNTLPNLTAVYGLMARVYLWDEDYTNAAIYADKAITAATGKKPLTEAEWTDPKTGFNTFNNSWIWGMQLTDQTSAVLTGICNFTSMVSVETTFGYAGVGAGAYPSVGRSFFDRVNTNDFRKSSWCPRAAQLSLITRLQLIRFTGTDKTSFVKSFEYGPVKFRPGMGNCIEYSEACAVGIPLMRIEEMHFIKMEAIAHSNPAEGKRLIEEFMNTYRMRSGTYTCTPTDVDGVVEEIVFQKRVEFWGEGLNFFDVKRLGYSVTRAYPNSNFYDDCKFNTNGRPAWFNMPFVRTEEENNNGLKGWNNPNVDGLYQPIKD